MIERRPPATVPRSETPACVTAIFLLVVFHRFGTARSGNPAGRLQGEIDRLESRGQRIVEHHEGALARNRQAEPDPDQIALDGGRGRLAGGVVLVPALDPDPVIIRIDWRHQGNLGQPEIEESDRARSLGLDRNGQRAALATDRRQRGH